MVGESSTAEIRDCILERNAAGIDVFTGSSAVLKGAIDVADNTLGGVAINGTSIIEIRGAHVRVSRNGGLGVVAGATANWPSFLTPRQVIRSPWTPTSEAASHSAIPC